MATSPGSVRDVEQKPSADDEFIHYDHIGHGSTPAAWTLCGIIMVAAVIAGVAFIGQWWFLLWVAGALVPVALIAGLVMKQMGYGVEMDSKAVLKRGEDPDAHRGPAIPDETSSPAKRKPAPSTD
ncbi:HGxxPAAW family protein [Nesterenkonia alba]|uniref:HGxxPAAW family protein n=1 Tax=Nesterenkonia alba TaxID=515814 RepID=UPI0003B37EB3|nr:HGxxPAAW family protein [Nesterenkonia alba]